MTKTPRKRYYETSLGVFSPMHIAEQAEAHKLARAEGDGPVSNETARAYLNAFPADKTAEGIHALAIVRGLRERNRELEKLARIGELAIAAQKSTDYYCNESTIQPSEEDWRIDGTEEHKLWNAMENKGDLKWLLPADVNPLYLEHLKGESKVEIRTGVWEWREVKSNAPNHGLDTSAMMLCMATIANVIRYAAPKE